MANLQETAFSTRRGFFPPKHVEKPAGRAETFFSNNAQFSCLTIFITNVLSLFPEILEGNFE